MTDHRRFFEYDPEIGRTVWLIFDDKGNLKGAHVEQEVDKIFARNSELEKETHGRRFGDYVHLASVPLTLLEKTGLGDAIDARDRKYSDKILNDPDFAKIRTSRGRA